MPVRLKVIPRLNDKQIERLWSRISTATQEKCWPWIGAASSGGYGELRIGSNTYKPHRIIYALFNPGWNQQTYVCHTCDNPCCCNPTHLFAGTAQDNSQDRDRKGRGRVPDQVGSSHARTKLTEADILTIRRQYAQGRTQSAIGQDYGLGQTAISRIVNSKRWPHV